MRLPFVQIAMEVVELASTDVAVQLGINPNEALGSLVHFIGWALARCPEQLPPSRSSFVEGAHAARLIAKATGLTVEPEAIVDALCCCSPSLLERTPAGFRVKGLDRYDAAWRKNHKAEWDALLRSDSAAKKSGNRAVQALNSSDSDAKPGGSAAEKSGLAPVQGLQIQTQTQTQKNLSTREPTVLHQPAIPKEPEAVMGFYAFTQEERAKTFRAIEQPVPQGIEHWYREAVQLAGTDQRLRDGWKLYCADPYARGLTPQAPWSAWVKAGKWTGYVKRAPDRPKRFRFIGKDETDEQYADAREAWEKQNGVTHG